MPKVDILLATYNGAGYLPELLASLEAQTHEDWRLIVRDDGSGDGSLALVRDWAADAGRALVVVEDGERNLGPARSFGRLLARSDAPYFAFCDQDDVWKPEKLSRLVAAAAPHGNGPVLAHCDLAVVSETLEPVEPSFWRERSDDRAFWEGAPGARARMFLNNPVTGCSMLGDAALRDAMLPLPDDVSMHDSWAALTAAYLGRIVAVDEPLVLYRQHGENAIGARVWTLGAMARYAIGAPADAIARLRESFGRRSGQTAAALERLGDAMTAEERGFAARFARADEGLWRPGGVRLFLWALATPKRWPLAAYLLVETLTPWRRRN